MRQKISKGGIVRRLSIALISALCLVTISPSPAFALNLLEKYFTLDYDIELSKTSIRGSETFYATVEGTATCKRNFPVRATKGYVTCRIVAEHQTSGSVVTLNESYTINIDPFPNHTGESTQASETVSLRFPTGSQSGSYDIKGRLITAGVNTTSLLRWLPVTRYLPSSQAMGTVTYTAGDDGFEVSDLTITPSEVNIGETVAIIVRITNTGDLAGTYEVTLTINDATVETKQVKVAGGAQQRIAFTLAKDAAGTYTVNVDGLSDTFEVKQPLAPAVFTTSELRISPAEVAAGEKVTISVVVANSGELAGTYEVTLTINDAAVETKQVEVAGGNSELVSFSISRDTPGVYQVNIDDLSGTFEVKAATEPKPINWRLIAIIAGVSVAITIPLVIRRRRLA